MDYYISSELIEIASTISCQFVDASTTAKEYVKKVYIENKKSEFDGHGFQISTCLRFESYFFKDYEKKSMFFNADGVLCLRRLLLILCGLQSEIIGEKEILFQVSNCIDQAHLSKRISDLENTGLQNLIKLAREVRKNCAIESDENYSTIGANLVLNNLQLKFKPTLLLIGGGYMVDKFLTSLNGKIGKIIWANRDIKKVKEMVLKLPEVSNMVIQFIRIDEIAKYSLNADAAFAAIAGGHMLQGIKMKKDIMVIDVSYPQFFESLDVEKHITLSNTYFEDFLSDPIPKKNIFNAYDQIEYIISRIVL
jgi:glutamyl-tRNA reductase